MWPEHEAALDAWLAVCDQWRIGPSGVVLGLDWPAVDVLLRLSGTDVDADLIGALRGMESEARRALTAAGTDSGAGSAQGPRRGE